MRELPHLTLYRRGTVAALVLAPALSLVNNILHPKEFTRDHEAEQLAEIAANYTRWQLGHALAFGAIIVFAAAVLGLAFLVRRRQPRLGLAGGALGLVGLLGFASLIALDGFTWGVLGEVYRRPGVDPATVELALHDVQQSDWATLYYSLPLAFIAGLLALSFGLVRQRAVPLWAGGLLALGTLLVGTEAAINNNAYFIAGSSVFLVGGAAVAHALGRMSDERFALGGPAPGP
jgi:hypothetical protein